MSANKAAKSSPLGPPWTVQASIGALNTTNPIREIIETMDLAENPEKKVIPLSIGDPTIFGNLKPCKQILDALDNANSSGKYYGYQTAAGMDSAREAVANYQSKCTGTKVKKQDVILASGCSHAIDLCICVLAKAGQNILIPRPGFPLYKTLTSVYGVHYKQYNLIAEKNWSIDLRHLESLIDENTAAIVINNPSNPCGSVFSRKHLLEILEIAEKYRKPIIADEIYDKFVFSSKFYKPNNASKIQQIHKSSFISASEILNSSASSVSIQQQQEQEQQQQQQHQHQSTRFELENREPKSTSCHAIFSGSDSDGDDERTSAASDESNLEEDMDESGQYSSSSIEPHEDEEEEENDATEGKEGDGSETNEATSAYVPFRALSSLSKVVPILTCGGISKTCLIPGLRLGWIIVHDPMGIFDGSVRNGLNRLTQRLMGPNSLVQGALADILTTVPESFYTHTMDFIFRNAKLCYSRLRLVKGLHPYMPQGSMYLMVRFDPKSFPYIDGDLDFTSKLMNEESVLVLPGKCFDFPNYFRICLTVPTNVMEKALDRMMDFCERHHIDTQERVREEKPFSSLVNKYTTPTKAPQISATNESAPPMKLTLAPAITNGQQANRCK